MTNSVDFSPDQETLTRNENSLDEGKLDDFVSYQHSVISLECEECAAQRQRDTLCCINPPTDDSEMLVFLQNKKILLFNHIIERTFTFFFRQGKNRLSVRCRRLEMRWIGKSNFIQSPFFSIHCFVLPRISAFSDSSEWIMEPSFLEIIHHFT